VSDIAVAARASDSAKGSSRIDLSAAEALAVFDAIADLLRTPHPFQPTRKTDL